VVVQNPTIERHKYSLLLASCLLIIVTLPIKENNWITTLTLIFNVVAGLNAIHKRTQRLATIIRIIGVATILLQFINHLVDYEIIGQILTLLYILYFVTISFTVYHDIYRADHIDVEMIAAVFCGFIMLGLLASFTFVIIESVDPNSFTGLSDDSRHFDDLVYFSFISLLTIGYGDMSPVTDLAKTTSIMAGLIGQFYTVFVTGIVIGKFLSGRTRG
jgi:hypothetical protein